MWPVKEIETIRDTRLAESARRLLRLLLFLALATQLCSPTTTEAQWKRLFDKGGINSIYFLDLPGAPRIGFATGYDSVLYKTTDGGRSWKDIALLHHATLRYADFAFKDSTNGWMSVTLSSDSAYMGVFKTSDQGDSWQLVPSPNSYSFDIFYDPKTKGIFVASVSLDGWCYRSWDEGVSWERMAPTGDENSASFAFATMDSGIMAYGLSPLSMFNWFRTFDGGHTWSTCAIDSATWQPLAIAGTQTYFALTSMGTVLRTDDSWNTWKVLYTFPWPASIRHNTIDDFPTTGCIRGTLDNLVVQTGDGCFRSTDQGIHWDYLCGPVSNAVVWSRFYAKDNYIYCAAEDDSTGISSIWCLDLNSRYSTKPDISSNFSNGRKQLDLASGSQVQVVFESQTDLFPDSVHLLMQYDPDALSYAKTTLPPNWTVTILNGSAGLLDLLCVNGNSVNQQKQLLQAGALSVTFNTMLSASSTEIVVERAQVLSHEFSSDCLGYHASADTLHLLFSGCGDSTLLYFMQNGKLPFDILSVQPNPTRSILSLHVKSELVQLLNCQLFDPLGVLKKSLELNSTEATLDVSDLPNGVYYLRVSQSGFVQSRKVVISR
jgi:photosystem II stability/assembly factor-like uncharacterized protein